MNFKEYISIANTRMFSCFVTRELAIAANNITNVDFFNDSLKLQSLEDMPIISLKDDAEDEDISKSMKFNIGYSKIFARVLGLILRPDNLDDIKGLKMEFTDFDAHDPNIIISELSIIFQYSLLESYEFSNYENNLRNGSIYEIVEQKFSLKDIKRRGIEQLKEGCIKDKTRNYGALSVKNRIQCLKKIGIDVKSLENEIDKYEKLSVRRNQIIHETKYNPPNILEAIEYFINSRDVAKAIGIAFNDNDAINYEFYKVDFCPDSSKST